MTSLIFLIMDIYVRFREQDVPKTGAWNGGVYIPRRSMPLSDHALSLQDDNNGEPRYIYLGSPLCENLPCHAKVPNQLDSADAIL